MRGSRIAAVVVAALIVLPSPASAAPATALRCAVVGVLTFSPGITNEGGGTFTGSGTATCQRQPATPPTVSGSIAFSGTRASSDTCALGAGSGTLSATLTGSDGSTLLFTARYSFLRTGFLVNGPVTATGDDTGFGRLNLALIPRAGRTCVTSPVLRADAIGAVDLTGTVR